MAVSTVDPVTCAGVTVGRAHIATAMLQSCQTEASMPFDINVTVGRARLATAMMQTNRVEPPAGA